MAWIRSPKDNEKPKLFTYLEEYSKYQSVLSHDGSIGHNKVRLGRLFANSLPNKNVVELSFADYVTVVSITCKANRSDFPSYLGATYLRWFSTLIPSPFSLLYSVDIRRVPDHTHWHVEIEQPYSSSVLISHIVQGRKHLLGISC